MKSQFLKALGVVMVGSALNYLGDRILGVRMELFSGLSTFSFVWALDVFLLPFLIGVGVSWMFGMGGKWLCYLPPLIVRCISYAQILYITGTPHGSNLIPMGWWGFFVILAVESASIGGIVGEVMIKKTYGRSNPENPKPAVSNPPVDVFKV